MAVVPIIVRAAGLATSALVLAGCTQALPGRASAVAPGPRATAALAAPGSPARPDAATAAAAALQQFWHDEFPAAFGGPWRDIARFVAVPAAERGAAPPPCVDAAADVTNQAFYCPSADAVVWDADGLVPELERDSGEAGVVVVLAHEIGHAVQTRLGADDAQARDPGAYPTILLEAQADCYAGVAVAHFATHPVPGITVTPARRDAALEALVGFRDPLGVTAGDAQAHGNAFDRVSAFQDGYERGPHDCAAMTVADHPFTQRAFGSADDLARGGNLPLEQLLAAVETDARAWFTPIGAAGPDRAWSAPPLHATSTGCGHAMLAAQGPAAYCVADPAVVADRRMLQDLEDRYGDYAAATLVASRYGLAALHARGLPTTGPAAGAAAGCLAGAYTGHLLDGRGPFSLSPGDLDEAVEVLLADSWATRDERGAADPATSGYGRVADFRAGVSGGPTACPGR